MASIRRRQARTHCWFAAPCSLRGKAEDVGLGVGAPAQRRRRRSPDQITCSIRRGSNQRVSRDLRSGSTTLNLLATRSRGKSRVLATRAGAAGYRHLRDRRHPADGVRSSGRLFALPAGDVSRRSLGTEWRKEAVQFDSLLGAFEREVGAGFAELQSAAIQPGHAVSLRCASCR